MSSSGYYPIDQWERQLDRIGGVVAAADRPFFFMEAGCPSRTTTTVRMANLPVSTSRVHIDNGRRTPGWSERHRAKEEPRPKSSPGGVLCRTGGSDRI
ncbi:glycoside hydrolase family 113 [Microbacterium lacticum]|uniref:glycoside hydrolase family 113 n=1 Tax=Microbacterium lacticum TaxID=33885 RepID=UPI0037CAAE5B